MAEASDVTGHVGDPASVQAVTRVNAEQASKIVDAQADPTVVSGKADTTGGNERSTYPQSLCRGSGDSMHTRKARATREAPWRGRG